METGLVFGLNIGDLFSIYDRDSQSWKMSECLFTGDFGKYSEALPRSGIMLNGKIYEQRTWVHRTGGKGYGLLPTPLATRSEMSHGYGDSLDERVKLQAGIPTRKSPTPTTQEIEHSQMELTETGRRKTKDKKSSHSVGLADTVKFPTPTVSDIFTGNLKSSQQKEGSTHSVTLPQMIQKFPTPTSRDWKDTGKNTNYQSKRMKNKLAGVVGGQLNPQWVDWLMGYPTGWTDLSV